MELRPDEITGIIKSKIKAFDSKITLTDTGTVVTVGDGIVRIHGLENCMINELLEFDNGVQCMALNLEQDFVGAVMLGSDAEIIGPIQMGLNKAIHFIDFGASVRDVVNIVAVATIDAYVDKIKSKLAALGK